MFYQEHVRATGAVGAEKRGTGMTLIVAFTNSGLRLAFRALRKVPLALLRFFWEYQGIRITRGWAYAEAPKHIIFWGGMFWVVKFETSCCAA